MNANTSGVLDNAGGDLDELYPDRHELGLGERTCRRDGVAQHQHQPVGGGMQDEPDLISRQRWPRTMSWLPFARMAVATPGDPGRRPMAMDAPGQMFDYGAHLFALGRLAFAQDHRHRFAALNMIDVDRQKAAAIVMGVPERQLLAAMHFIDGVVDVEDGVLGGGGKAYAELICKRRRQARRFDFRRHVLQPAHGRLRA